jgi:two-component system sensor histidine kinase BaeS
MLDRLTSLRVWLLVAMLVTAVVTIAAGSAIGGGLPAQGIVVAGVIAILVIGEAWLAATMLIRTVRKPVSRAIETADRLATGDFSARMGISGPEEFAHLSRAVDGMAGQLQQADTEQKRFLADLAHEIATPLSAVSGFAFALVDQSARTKAERAEAATIVVRESDRLQQLLEDVRHLHRLELAESVRKEQVDIGMLCTDTAQRFRLAAQHAGVTLAVSTEQVSVIADPRLIDAVVNNFVSNAIRYTPSGGGVQIRAYRRRSATVIAVRDTGIGIAPQHLERIFDRLYRVDNARDRATGGSGLGLAIARRAAQSLGARIEVESKPAGGSEFSLLMPSVAPHVRRTTQPGAMPGTEQMPREG